MTGGAYYNEFDPGAARWLRELIHEGLIAPGVVDDRSIRDVRPADLRGFAQCHFFAGIGVWSHALRRAGWTDDEPVWTGSCPCQPFSAAGKQKGFADDRHLWPEWLRLIGECRPHRIFGEQVASADAWLDLVRPDLEGLGFAIGAVDLPAAGFGGAHIRQRFFWVADADNAEWWADNAPGNHGDWPAAGRVQGHRDAGGRGAAVGLADPEGGGFAEFGDAPGARSGGHAHSGIPPVGLAHAPGAGWGQTGRDTARHLEAPGAGAGDRLGDAGAPCEWLHCRDGRWRPVEPGTSPLAPATPGRVGLLRGYGNGLDAETATQFVAAYIDVAPFNWKAAA